MTAIDKEALKNALIELIREEPAMIRGLLKETLTEVAASEKPTSFVSNEDFDQYTKENFIRFDATFRALA